MIGSLQDNLAVIWTKPNDCMSKVNRVAQTTGNFPSHVTEREQTIRSQNTMIDEEK